MVSVETVRCHKVGRIVLYPMPNKLLPPKKLTHCVLLIFYPFRDKKEVLLGFPPIYPNKLSEQLSRML